MHDVHRNLGQVTRFMLKHDPAALRTGQRQQLVHGMRGPHAGAANLAQGKLQVLRAGPFALGQIGLHAQTGQRRLQLVCSFGQKALLGCNGVGQAQ